MPRKPAAQHPLGVVREIISKRFPLSQLELAKMLGCSPNYVQRIETEKSPLTKRIAEQCDALLGTSFSSWIEDENSSNDYPIDEQKIIDCFIDRQFEKIDNFHFSDHQQRAYWRPILEKYGDGDESNHHAFNHKASRAVNPIIDKFVSELANAINGLGLTEEGKSVAIETVLDSLTSGHPFSTSNAVAWQLASIKGMEREIAWQHRKWINQMHDQHGLGMDDFSFYSSSDFDPFLRASQFGNPHAEGQDYTEREIRTGRAMDTGEYEPES